VIHVTEPAVWLGVNLDERHPRGQVDLTAVPARPEQPAGEAVFVEELRRNGFGVKVLTEPKAPAAFVDLAQSVCATIRRGLPVADVVRGLFDSNARPTLQQAERFVDSAIRCFDPELRFAVDEGRITPPVTYAEKVYRTFWLGLAVGEGQR